MSKWFPTNGAEGDEFYGLYCSRCVHNGDNPDYDECDLWSNAFCLGTEPSEWVWEKGAKAPICQKFTARTTQDS